MAVPAIQVLVVPPRVEESSFLQRSAKESSIHSFLRDREEMNLLTVCLSCARLPSYFYPLTTPQCDACGLEPQRCSSVTATARPIAQDRDNTYYYVFARWHRENCPHWQTVHPWSTLFCEGRPGKPGFELRGPLLFIKRQGGVPGTQGAHHVIPHPGRMVSLEQDDVDHVFAYCKLGRGLHDCDGHA
jgi:hypothetical protein